jgi:hypothetical protein
MSKRVHRPRPSQLLESTISIKSRNMTAPSAKPWTLPKPLTAPVHNVTGALVREDVELAWNRLLQLSKHQEMPRNEGLRRELGYDPYTAEAYFYILSSLPSEVEALGERLSIEVTTSGFTQIMNRILAGKAKELPELVVGTAIQIHDGTLRHISREQVGELVLHETGKWYLEPCNPEAFATALDRVVSLRKNHRSLFTEGASSGDMFGFAFSKRPPILRAWLDIIESCIWGNIALADNGILTWWNPQLRMVAEKVGQRINGNHPPEEFTDWFYSELIDKKWQDDYRRLADKLMQHGGIGPYAAAPPM